MTVLLSRQENVEKLVFNFDPENVPYLSQLRDLQSKDGGSQNDTRALFPVLVGSKETSNLCSREYKCLWSHSF